MERINKAEIETRVNRIREIMDRDKIDVFLIYGDEYRRENLRYLSNYWPIFERGIVAIGLKSEPVLLVSPECFHIAKEMSVWQDIRLIREVGMSYVPEEVEFTNIDFTNLADVIKELTAGKHRIRVKLAGIDAMSVILFRIIETTLKNAEIISGDKDIYNLRYIKSPLEIRLLKNAWEICDKAYKEVLDTDIIGLTEKQVAAIGEKAAFDSGAESIVFSIFCSGERTNTVVGRPSDKVINKNDMIMYALCIQYEGYIASNEWPFIAGGGGSKEQNDFIYHLVNAENLGVKNLKNGVRLGTIVKSIRKYFSDNGLERFDLYPPIHGNGLSEAESPYPDENSPAPLLKGIGINFDVSLFGSPVGSNRIEEGFVMGEEEPIVLSGLISRLREDFLSDYNL
ncbi:MAG: aminopeptidase P family protein [Actinobacteria bacterium]|nr:aminopeptidase P family protein [Actinomycetota bacterium]